MQLRLPFGRKKPAKPVADNTHSLNQTNSDELSVKSVAQSATDKQTDQPKDKSKTGKKISPSKPINSKSMNSKPIGDDGEELVSDSDLVAGRNYWFVMASLVLIILATAIKTVHQTQERHAVYRELSQAKQAYRDMHIEEQRLIIEQQTFSATPIVAQRAVTELGMFYPVDKNRLVITLDK